MIPLGCTAKDSSPDDPARRASSQRSCDRDAIVRALQSGHLAGYAGDAWFPRPSSRDDPSRTMPNHGMAPHVSGSSLSAHARYAAGTREVLECWFENRPIRDEYLIVADGKLSGTGTHSYTEGDATRGSEAADGSPR